MDPNQKLLEFAKMIDKEYEQTWLNDDDKEITTEELAKEFIATQPKYEEIPCVKV